ncbi:MAG: phenylacetic acid degradation bifunctional protein PaaZ [Gemmatimonadales bacterium]|nr:MAG: phenylacetic acid degradation bifunctional protein PaaZ [Gemmatimonadales bacterium]
MRLKNFVLGKAIEGGGDGTPLVHAVTGEQVAVAGTDGIDFQAALDYGRLVGGPALRKMTFHERARMLKALAKYLMDRKEEFYPVSAATGATKGDSWIDIEGGIGTLFVYASKGRRDFPDETFHVDGPMEALSKNGTFVGRHICVPLEGIAIHINAFNFPCWGMLEKLAPTLLAGMPALVKPATVTSFLTNRMVAAILESQILPPGALQLVCGSIGDALDHLMCQDVVTFTGSALTGRKLKTHPAVIEHSVRFNMEADSLNYSILGPDAGPDTEEFGLFIKEVAKEMTVKAGQKCTAIRRAIVPSGYAEAVVQSLGERLSTLKLGDPATEGVRMGPLVGKGQVQEVRQALGMIAKGAEQVFGDLDNFELLGGDREAGAFFPSVVLYCDKPFDRSEPHEVEAFGPVSTVMPYETVDDAVALARLGKGSLCGSVFTADDRVARDLVLGTASHHGRIMVLNRHCAKESTGHGSPLAHLVHGGPGRAGGGEELGGMRGVRHFMQRTALQGSPTTLTQVTNQWLTGADTPRDSVHPFRKYFDELQIGETLITHRRTITEADIVQFAGLSGDFFYAHTDDIAARESIFEKRVAHGYFVLSAAAGLFVDPAPGPVLANYGRENLRFVKPVYIGDTIRARLTCKQKTAKDLIEGQPLQGVVAWDVEVSNQEGEAVALYVILTLVARR